MGRNEFRRGRKAIYHEKRAKEGRMSPDVRLILRLSHTVCDINNVMLCGEMNFTSHKNLVYL